MDAATVRRLAIASCPHAICRLANPACKIEDPDKPMNCAARECIERAKRCVAAMEPA